MLCADFIRIYKSGPQSDRHPGPAWPLFIAFTPGP